MRDYHIYRQTAKCMSVHMGYSLWKWLPFEYVCAVSGTKELYKLFNNRNFCDRWSLEFHNSFMYNKQWFKRNNNRYWDFFNEKPIERFLIVDDKGNPRDYHELTDKYRKKYRYCNRHRPHRCHWFSNISEQRRSITPVEIKEMKDEYGITMLPIKPKRNRDPWDDERSCAISRGWKAQTKRRKQYKPKEVT